MLFPWEVFCELPNRNVFLNVPQHNTDKQMKDQRDYCPMWYSQSLSYKPKEPDWSAMLVTTMLWCPSTTCGIFFFFLSLKLFCYSLLRIRS